eukprot:c19433_g1_i1.p1 GENE.c19433_g1_i1~~c19433_g1_i1.p1  ORF type:complete len:289 (+),score=34.95 c19433_g1_i1:26-892(+)
MSKKILLVILVLFLTIGIYLCFKVHNNPTKTFFRGTYIVLGSTGSGKSTLINYMTQTDTSDMLDSSFGSSVNSVTKGFNVVESKRTTINDVEAEFRFMDSIGFDAHDIDNDRLFRNITKQILLMGDPRINAVVLVHKMERFRSKFAHDLDNILRMFKLFDIKKEHILVVITHSALYSDDVREKYTKDLSKKLYEYVRETNIMHVNFVKYSEIDPAFIKHFEDSMPREFDKLAKKLMKYTNPFNPQNYVMDRIKLDEQIQKDLDNDPDPYFCNLLGTCNKKVKSHSLEI